jgi:hypothetical protein
MSSESYDTYFFKKCDNKSNYISNYKSGYELLIIIAPDQLVKK